MNTYDSITSDMLEYTEIFSGKKSTKYQISKIKNSNDLYIYKETAIINRDGPYLEPIGKHGEKGGNLLNYYKIKTDSIIVPSAYIFIKKDDSDSSQLDKYLKFFRNQITFNSEIAELMDDIY